MNLTESKFSNQAQLLNVLSCIRSATLTKNTPVQAPAAGFTLLLVASTTGTVPYQLHCYI